MGSNPARFTVREVSSMKTAGNLLMMIKFPIKRLEPCLWFLLSLESGYAIQLDALSRQQPYLWRTDNWYAALARMRKENFDILWTVLSFTDLWYCVFDFVKFLMKARSYSCRL